MRAGVGRGGVWLGVALVGWLGGCDLVLGLYSDEIDQAQQQLEQLQVPEPPPLVKKKEEPEVKEEYKRPELEARRDPFVFVPPKPQGPGDDVLLERPLTELEKYPLQTLKLTAIVTGTAVPKAMFSGPDGFGHIAVEGDRIGQDNGRITEIRDNEVEVTLGGQDGVTGLDSANPDAKPGEAAEPVTVVMRLTDTVLEAPEETTEQEKELLNKIKGGPAPQGGGAPQGGAPQGGGGQPSPFSPVAPPSVP